MHLDADRRATRAGTAGIAAMVAFAVAALVLGFAPAAPLLTVLLTAAAVGASVALAAQAAFARPLLAVLASERHLRHAVDAELEVARRRRGLVEQLDRAVDLADSEDEALQVVGRALALLLPDRDNAVLLAPPDQSRVTFSVPASAEGLGIPEPTGEPLRCAALSLGHPVTAESSDALDACPHLAATGGGWEVSSMCVPLKVADRHLGVAHSTGPAGDLPDEEARRLVEFVTRRVGARIAGQRAERRAPEHPAVDPLTGLPLHSAAFRRIRDLLGASTAFSVALCDADHFARFNDEHGDESGDRALRTYADVLAATLRPNDLVARFAGDRFLCVFTDCTAANAGAAMERVREALTLDLALADMPPFTVSVGVADSTDGSSVEELVEAADVALAFAKHGGGNRVAASTTIV